MADNSLFFEQIKPLFNGKFKQTQVDGINALLKAFEGLPVEYAAYLFATAYHETARTMQPIAEYGKGKGKKYGRPGKHWGQVAYGRGYVQLTWDYNYQRADSKLELDGQLIRNYDLAMNPTIAAKILVRGCVEGWFTGKKLGDYLPGDYVNARRVVNGTDKARAIAVYARVFERALRVQANRQPILERQTSFFGKIRNIFQKIFKR